MKKLSFVVLTVGLAALLSISVPSIGVAQVKSGKDFTLDVACNGSTLAPPVFPIPRGDVAVVTGRVYLGGTLPSGVTTVDPSVPGGIGTWRCFFASLDESPIAGAATYYFTIEENGEENMLVVQGLNSHVPSGSIPRVHAIIGGTGKYEGASGEVREDVIGGNASGCFNLRFQFSLKKKPK